MPEIKIHISKEGEINIETHGFAGASCQAATKAIEEALGTIRSEILTEEFYLEDGIDSHVTTKEG